MNNPTIHQVSKLVSVSMRTLPNGKFRYLGHFDNGTTRQLREGHREYAQVTQVAPATYAYQLNGKQHALGYGEDFVFGNKTPKVHRTVVCRVMVTVVIEKEGA